MRIPNRLKIGATLVEVCLPDSLKLDDGDILGISKGSVGKMEIATTYRGEACTEDSMADTFLHEIIHIFSQNMGMGLTERQVTGVAGAMLMVIRDNDLDFRKGE